MSQRRLEQERSPNYHQTPASYLYRDVDVIFRCLQQGATLYSPES